MRLPRRSRASGSADRELSLIEHLEELRRRLLWVVVSIAVGLGVGWWLTPPVLDHLIVPVGETVFLAPGEAFHTHLKVAFGLAVVFAFPVLVYQIGAFVWPALHRGERKHVIVFVPFAVALFVTGMAFAYLVLLPILFRFFLGFSSPTIQPFISVAAYVSFVLGLVLPSGLLFQMPILVLFLSRLGLVTPASLRRNRKLALLIIIVLAAFLTPPDIVSQLLMAGPLLGLYEISTLLAYLGNRAYRRKLEG